MGSVSVPCSKLRVGDIVHRVAQPGRIVQVPAL